jgi:hypothetical protein
LGCSLQVVVDIPTETTLEIEISLGQLGVSLAWDNPWPFTLLLLAPGSPFNHQWFVTRAADCSCKVCAC